ncbi:hydrolase [Streptomyces sp. P9(2023)]|uniref:alpha/beta hydrolase family protein n=1 Tax=Streptomyces sp. P9(2023) TaxID=3064394 RepID=UPI0028F435E6|nr:alpha/beta family hydrolase [Streptomyces sp. P9(2023)]MDT9688257.1 hydrolase [Streptomyces sp. P9(2023)]
MGRMSRTESVATDAGEGRITWFPGKKAWAVLALSHGAGGGIEARDLQALAGALPAEGVSVALVEQPWRVAGKKVAPAPKTLDVGWRGIWPALAEPGLPVIAGGRSAGARVACRTGKELGALAVLALSFPLHPPGKPEKSRADELLGTGLPTLVLQGGNDSFGKPEEFPGIERGRAQRVGARVVVGDGWEYTLVEVPYGDHGFAVAKRAPVTPDETLGLIVREVSAWVASLRS